MSAWSIHLDAVLLPFADTQAELCALMEQHIQQVLEKIFQEYNTGGPKALSEDQGFRNLVREKRRAVEARFLDLGKEGLRSILLQMAHRIADTNRASCTTLEITIHQTAPLAGETMPVAFTPLSLRRSEECVSGVLQCWLPTSAVLFPVHPWETLAIHFDGRYPLAARVAAGGIDVVTGTPAGSGLGRSPQNYFVTSTQRWLDGFLSEQGRIRQFVAVPSGQGLSAQEQIPGATPTSATLQMEITPLRPSSYFERHIRRGIPTKLSEVIFELVDQARQTRPERTLRLRASGSGLAVIPTLGIAAGDSQMQPVYEDRYDLSDWDTARTVPVTFVLCAAHAWCSLTGDRLPPCPPRAGFDPAKTACIYRLSNKNPYLREIVPDANSPIHAFAPLPERS